MDQFLEDDEDDLGPDPSEFLEATEMIEDDINTINIKDEPMDEPSDLAIENPVTLTQSEFVNFKEDIRTEKTNFDKSQPKNASNSVESTDSSTENNFSVDSSELANRSEIPKSIINNSAKAFKSYIRSISTPYVVDNVQIFVKNLTNTSYKGSPVHLDCPCCLNMEAYTDIGHHLDNVHSATHIACPGSKCGTTEEVKTSEFTQHLLKHHMNIGCSTCGQSISAPDMMKHAKLNHPNIFGKVPKTKRINVQVTTLDTDESEVEKTVVYEVFQNGQLVIVDGVHYFVKKEVAFIDCPMCVSKSMALTLIPEHIKEDHFLETIKCPADLDLCNENLPVHELIKHLVTTHGRLPCEFCGIVLLVTELYNHMTKFCSLSYYLKSKSNSESMLAKPNIRTKSLAYNSTVYRSLIPDRSKLEFTKKK